MFFSVVIIFVIFCQNYYDMSDSDLLLQINSNKPFSLDDIKELPSLSTEI